MPHGYGNYTTRKSVFVGWDVLSLSVYTSDRLWRKVRFWTLAAVTFLAISLGPFLQVGGVKYKSIRFLWGDAIARFFRAPDRFYILISLALTVLVGYGLALLVSRSRSADRKPVGAWILGGVMLFEFLYFPFPTLQPTVPRFYEQIADEPGEFAVLDIPMGNRREYMYYQTIHGRPLVEGTLSRTPSEVFAYIADNPFLFHLREEDVMDPKLTDISRQLMNLAEDDIRYLIIHKTKVDPNTLAQWFDYLVVPPYYESEELAVYRTYPPHGAAPTLLGEWEPGLGLVGVKVDSDGTLGQESTVEVNASWLSTQVLSENLAVHIALVGENEEFVQTSQWPVGTVASNQYTWQVDPFVPPGSYSLVLTIGETSDSSLDRTILLNQVELESLPRCFEVPPMTQALDIGFGEQLKLLGCDLVQSADSVRVILHWQALRRMDVAFKMFVHVLDPRSGELVAQADVMPHGWAYPTHWWEAGEVVSDEVVLPLAQVPSGRYVMAVGVYVPDGERLRTADEADHIILDEEIIVP